MADERNLMDGLGRAIEERLFTFLDNEGFRLCPPGKYQKDDFLIQYSPRGRDSKGDVNMNISLRPKEKDIIYQWTPISGTELSVFSREYGITIHHKENGLIETKPILRDMAGYNITQLELDYSPQ